MKKRLFKEKNTDGIKGSSQAVDNNAESDSKAENKADNKSDTKDTEIQSAVEKEEKKENVDVRDALNKIGTAITELSELFVKKIADNEENLFVIKDLKAKVEMHEKDYYFSIMKPVLFEMIDIRESMISQLKYCNSQELRAKLGPLIRQVELSLEKFSIFSCCNNSDVFDPKTQQAIDAITTTDKGLSGKIAERVTSGYFLKTPYRDRIIKPETVKVYK